MKQTVELVAGAFNRSNGVGIHRYSWELLDGLGKSGIRVKPVTSNHSNRRFALAFSSFVTIPTRTLAALGGAAVVHSTDPSAALSLPFTGHKTVVTFHDFMPLLMRGSMYGRGERAFALATYRLASRCDAIIAVSTQTKHELVELLGVPEHKIRVVNEGVAEDFSVRPEVTKEQTTVGYVGDINPRKRIDFLIKGFATLRKRLPNARLLIVGTNTAAKHSVEMAKLTALVRELDVGGSVEFTGRVSEDRLVQVYNAMKVLVMPSEYEGFGLPILESEACGTPVVVREGVRIPTEVSSASLKVGSPEELADVLQRLLKDDPLYRERVALALEHRRQFTWERCVRETIEVYDGLAG